jgi:hypothetical protein
MSTKKHNGFPPCEDTEVGQHNGNQSSPNETMDKHNVGILVLIFGKKIPLKRIVGKKMG